MKYTETTQSGAVPLLDSRGGMHSVVVSADKSSRRANYDDCSVRSGSSFTSLSSTFTVDSGKHGKSKSSSCSNLGYSHTSAPSQEKQLENQSGGGADSQQGEQQQREQKQPPPPPPQVPPRSLKREMSKRRRRRSRGGGLRRSVHFHEGMNQWYASVLSRDDLVYMWLQEEDYADFHESMNLAVTAITIVPEKEESCANVLDRLFEAYSSTCPPAATTAGATTTTTTTTTTATTTTTTNGSSHSATSFKRKDRRKLRTLFKTTPDLLGLERAVSSMINQDRTDRRSDLIEKIEDLQSCGWPDDETEARKLAEASLAMTRPHRMFARQMAIGIAPSSSKSSFYSGGSSSRNLMMTTTRAKSARCLTKDDCAPVSSPNVTIIGGEEVRKAAQRMTRSKSARNVVTAETRTSRTTTEDASSSIKSKRGRSAFTSQSRLGSTSPSRTGSTSPTRLGSTSSSRTGSTSRNRSGSTSRTRSESTSRVRRGSTSRAAARSGSTSRSRKSSTVPPKRMRQSGTPSASSKTKEEPSSRSRSTSSPKRAERATPPRSRSRTTSTPQRTRHGALMRSQSTPNMNCSTSTTRSSYSLKRSIQI